mmetsp:Transcript_40577/g.101483  ORF Transcript_40577/g.101483 Transcript_40577/m.101483 type:complete len:80 (+) Transcript_40577:691-930(+)
MSRVSQGYKYVLDMDTKHPPKQRQTRTCTNRPAIVHTPLLTRTLMYHVSCRQTTRTYMQQTDRQTDGCTHMHVMSQADR